MNRKREVATDRGTSGEYCWEAEKKWQAWAYVARTNVWLYELSRKGQYCTSESLQKKKLTRNALAFTRWSSRKSIIRKWYERLIVLMCQCRTKKTKIGNWREKNSHPIQLNGYNSDESFCNMSSSPSPTDTSCRENSELIQESLESNTCQKKSMDSFDLQVFVSPVLLN